MINDKNRIRFALPGKGRLREPAIELLMKSGFNFRAKDRNLYATCTNDDIVFIFVRTDDVPVLVQSGVIDCGITGSDLVIERQTEVKAVLPLDFGKCRLCVAVKEDFNEKNFSAFEGKKIATSFPNITKKFFQEKNINIDIIEMNGSVEIMIALGLADAIVDIVETGDSLRDNNLKIFCEIGNYETQLICSKALADDQRIEKIKKRIEGILIAEKYSVLEYNIREDRLKDAEKIAPGFESPTVSKLDEEGWVAVKVMVPRKETVSVMDALANMGASAIFETKIVNCRL
ncbi:MAG: ATP phosphoribosyltransferase [Spirochaetes bacterium]|nr:ATP phosphoribosyltransferase [Spirochaetota bacterium]